MSESFDFSVIVPTCNRGEQLGVCLRALWALDFPGSGYEIIVVDDASAVAAEESVSGVGGGVRTSFVRLPRNEGPAAARNHGARQAKGRYLAFTDDDCRPAPDWLKLLKQCAESAPGRAIGGRIVDEHPERVCSAASQAIFDAVYGYYNADRRNARFFASANLAVPAGLFREAGGFDPAYRTSEDREFCARWLRRGYGLVYVPEAVVVHDTPAGFWKFCRRHYHYGEGAYRFRRQQALEESAPLRLEGQGFYRRLLRSPFAQAPLPRATLTAALVLISQIASALGFVREFLRQRCAGPQTSAGRTG